MSQPSDALRSMLDAARLAPPTRPITWGDLVHTLSIALEAQEYAEHDEYMGSDQ